MTWLVWFACTATSVAVVPETDELTPLPQPTETVATPKPTQTPATPVPTEVSEIVDNQQYANVTKVSVAGNPGSYRFSITITSPDTGCDQFADWWEVLSSDGELLYRRVLLHSHVNEQPFTRSGSSVNLQADEEIIVRAHMNTSGYGGAAMQGAPGGEFEQVDLASDFAREVESLEPLPTDCAF